MSIYRLVIPAFLLAACVFAQSDRGVITGSVTDAAGAVIPGAEVRATNVASGTPYATTTTDTGDYTIPSVQPGVYRLAVTQQGFKQFQVSNVVLIAGGTVRVDARLEIGQVTESIEVSSDIAQIQTETAKISTQVSTKMVDELPLVVGGAMRGAFDLALITPEANEPEDKGFNIGGAQGGSYGATLDGVSILTSRFNSVQWANVNTPSVDAITEFAVETNGFKAEYGRAQGGMITFASKSGTNQLHGTAYEFLRNDALDARRFFEAQKGKYKQHDFGYSAGGPVFIPKLYDGRNKTFFFTAGEWFRNRVGAGSGRFSVPTPEMYNGDFSNWVNANNQRLSIYDPSTTRANPSGSGFIRTPFAGNRIPQARFSPLIQNYLKEVAPFAQPNNGAAPGTSDYVRNNYINSSGTALDPWTKYSVKADHNFGINDKVSFLYNYGLHERVPGPDGFPGLPGPLNSNRIDNQKSHVYRGTYSKVITPTLVNYMYGGVNFWKERHDAITLDGGWEAKGICLKGAWDCNRNLLRADFSDYTGWVANAYDGSENFVFSFGNDLTWTKGKHTVKAGYLWERMHYNGFGQQTIGGLVRGDRRLTSVPNNNNLNTGGGNGFASLLLGESFSGGTENDRFVGQQWRSHAWYIQDDFKLSQRLTVNLGLRYEFTLPPLEQNDKWSDFDPTRPNPRANGIPGALKFAGFGEGRENSRTITPGWFGGISPRFGLAYAIGSSTVVRASVGRSFGVVKTVTGSTHFEGSTLVFRPASLDNGVTPAFRVDEGLPPYQRPPVIDPSFSNGNNTAYWDNEAVRLPETYQWTFSIQRQLGGATVLETTYNATVGAHLVAGLKRPNQLPFSVYQQYGRSVLAANMNSALARNAGLTRPYANIDCDFSTTCAPVGVAQALRPFPQYRDIQTRQGHGDKSGHSSYHSWLTKIERRYSAGLTLQGSYVVSKILTDADSTDGDNGAIDHYNRRLEKSIGQYDLTHNLKMTYIYELPFGKGKPFLTDGPLSWVLGNWRLAGTQFYSSGFPLALVNSNNYLIFNGRSAATVSSYDNWIVNHGDNPNWLGSDRFFQPSSFFGAQPLDRLGNATRFNPKARQPWNLNENFSLAKSFRITESTRVDFRWELFNAFNRVRFATGSVNVQDPNFGRVQGTLNGPRRMQLGLKLYF
ncbi:MAG: carboxypeptidase regulatory-like domain-containing protein [Bryobacteraceae bacterium]